MRCDDCYGIGEILIDCECRPVVRLRDAVMMIPCPNCGGSGITSCCDGAVGGPRDVTNNPGK